MGDEGNARSIVALVTASREAVGGGKPILFANSDEEAATLAADVARATDADVFLLSNGVYLIVSTRP